MKIFRKKRFSKWFFLFLLLWYFSFCIMGISSGENSEPTTDSNPVLDTIYIFVSPFVLSFIFYHLYRRINQYIVFAITPLLGLAMEWLLFKPADVLSESTNTQASFFFAFIWMAILIPPYYFTVLSSKSKGWFYGVLIFLIAFLATQILLLILD